MDSASPSGERAWARYTGEPDAARSVESYASLAAAYDVATRRITGIRRRAIDALRLRRGETVFDVGCGAGASLSMLAAACGPDGRVVGIEHSPEMCRIASRRTAHLPNVTVLCTSVQEVRETAAADAMLLCYTHDILQSSVAIARLSAMGRPGCRIAIAGMHFLPWSYGFAVNAFNAYRARRYLTTYRGMGRPWALIERSCSELRIVARDHLGSSYLAVGSLLGAVA